MFAERIKKYVMRERGTNRKNRVIKCGIFRRAVIRLPENCSFCAATSTKTIGIILHRAALIKIGKRRIDNNVLHGLFVGPVCCRSRYRDAENEHNTDENNEKRRQRFINTLHSILSPVMANCTNFTILDTIFISCYPKLVKLFYVLKISFYIQRSVTVFDRFHKLSRRSAFLPAVHAVKGRNALKSHTKRGI